jgi:hypothetical protein
LKLLPLPAPSRQAAQNFAVDFAAFRIALQYQSGAARGIRTPDPVITNDVLYQLSYCGDEMP